MERHARPQLRLRLQRTVEGLSVAAVTYQVAGLIGYVAKALADAGLSIEPEVRGGSFVPLAVVLL